MGIIPFQGFRGGLSNVGFRRRKRHFIVRQMLEWINPGPLPLFVEDAANVFPLRRDGQEAVVIGIGNLTPDTLPRLTFRVAPFSKGTPRLESLSPRKPVVYQQKHQDGYWRFQVVCAVPPLELACFKITVR